MDPAFLAVLAILLVVCAIAGSSAARRRQLARREPVVPPLPPSQVAREVPVEWQRAIGEQLALGNKIMAIKMYREATGVGLKEAKDAVELWAGPTASLPRYGIGGGPPGRTVRAVSSESQRAIGEQLALGNKITAIKMYRDATGVGLKEAKDAVELWEREGVPLPTSGVADSPAVEGQNPYGPLDPTAYGIPDPHRGGDADGGNQDQWPQLPPTNRS